MVYNSIPYIIISSSIVSAERKAIFHVHKFSAVKTAGESIMWRWTMHLHGQ